jgi:hypothetical protein
MIGLQFIFAQFLFLLCMILAVNARERTSQKIDFAFRVDSRLNSPNNGASGISGKLTLAVSASSVPAGRGAGL